LGIGSGVTIKKLREKLTFPTVTSKKGLEQTHSQKRTGIALVGNKRGT